ncbi:MAG: GFA family protein [Pseudomonadota bacterium]
MDDIAEHDAPELVTGSCLCGSVSYTINGPFRPVIACHCQQCRKTSGHHVAATSAPRNSIEIAGDVTWYASSDTARRGFCGLCGSNLFWDGKGSHLSIFAGTLDGPTGMHLAGHIFCADKGDYYEINDGLPQAPQDDPDFTTQVP